MMVGVEIDFVVEDSLGALACYEAIFDVERIEVTAYPRGQNEAVFSIYGTRFHMLDENPSYQLVAPKSGDPKPIWFNVMVQGIQATHKKALEQGCAEVQPVTEVEEMGVANSIFADPFGYVWMLHQVCREVSFAERSRIMEKRMKE